VSGQLRIVRGNLTVDMDRVCLMLLIMTLPLTTGLRPQLVSQNNPDRRINNTIHRFIKNAPKRREEIHAIGNWLQERLNYKWSQKKIRTRLANYIRGRIFNFIKYYPEEMTIHNHSRHIRVCLPISIAGRKAVIEYVFYEEEMVEFEFRRQLHSFRILNKETLNMMRDNREDL